jgi:hypothetical protein
MAPDFSYLRIGCFACLACTSVKTRLVVLNTLDNSRAKNCWQPSPYKAGLAPKYAVVLCEPG